ncbi:hypothetical protein JCM19294_2068 [Nonlabens tegetincola]|uniref:Uncharacterized protein n=1 Tax=Nonlabens tegetincola TaxID=323273 RepID=A0A090Q0M2_9FLAO|nr:MULTISPECIES: hemerythrin domain-containing protein [Nonlabens]MEE2800660.1 hemerythrin domain-containing protein [Bacteroidota bacterium]ALM21761.1 hemerythrin [Nonlabens sp. MIC269]ARN71507.1 hemerythrin [Nonlabens tegetincola]PQJ14012.1 hemerythrin [Nonlabens tegetincola]GAK96555.1 hypothetical protein JCM19294_2068 [Nonlabens tegetincola]
MNIFEAIREDHEKQRDYCKKLLDTSGDSEFRRNIWEELKKELQIHADAEEKYFYVPLFKDDLTQDKARHSVAEHHEIDELIEKLNDTDFDSSAWLAHMKNLADKVIHHLDEEEHEVFQLAGKSLSENQKKSLASDYKDAMQSNR